MMNEARLPKVWDEMMEKLIYMPAIVKTIEKIHDTNWSMNASKQDYYEMVYVKKGTAVFQVEGVEVHRDHNGELRHRRLPPAQSPRNRGCTRPGHRVRWREPAKPNRARSRTFPSTSFWAYTIPCADG